MRLWAAYRRNRAAVLGLVLLAGLGLVALLAPDMSAYGPFERRAALQPPSGLHPFGTDDLGRDVYSRVLHGARTSLLVGLGVGALSLLLGLAVGGPAGHRGGLADDLLMRLTEVVQVVPVFFLALLVIALFGPGLDRLVLVLGLTYWPITARLLRAQLFSLQGRDFVTAARMLGEPEAVLFLRHLLPNALPPVIVHASYVAGSAILVEAGLSFLGLGDPQAVSLGTMLQGAQGLLRVAPWTSLFPGLAVVLAVTALNLVGDGLNDAWNPRLRG